MVKVGFPTFFIFFSLKKVIDGLGFHSGFKLQEISTLTKYYLSLSS